MNLDMRVIMTDPRKENYFYEESIKTLRTNIQFTGKNVKTILLTSCYPNEGKSDIAMQLAQEIGKAGKRVLLIDADLRKSAYIVRYKVKRSVKGLSEFLSGQASESEIKYTTNFQNVDIIFSGPSAPNPSELLEEPAFGELMKKVRMEYDFVLLDTPPVMTVIDAAVIAKESDGAVLIVESGRVSYKAAQKALEQIRKSDCKVLGAVLNKVDIKRDKYYSEYSSYYG